jgi:hypothetical protein
VAGIIRRAYDVEVQDFTGIAEKLKRAEANIGNLYFEMQTFFEESDYPVIPEDDSEMLRKATEYHANRVIPPRFSVLAGEIIHHFRSCFDHVVWHFSDPAKVKEIRRIEFPVFFEKPLNSDERRRFERKIEGITNPYIRDLIERFQPYKAANPADDPLWLIHDFDIIDKHRELILTVATSSIVLPRRLQGVLEAYQRKHPELDPAQVARKFKQHGAIRPNVSFRNFGRRQIESVSEGLIKLCDYTTARMDDFRNI